jgi:hypothetical protein
VIKQSRIKPDFPLRCRLFDQTSYGYWKGVLGVLGVFGTIMAGIDIKLSRKLK